MLRPAKRAEAIAPFEVMRILEHAKVLEAQGLDVIHMEVGEPRFAMPKPLRDAARRALSVEPMGYTPSAGLPKLRRAIAEHYGRRFGLDVDPARVIVTPGGSGALQLALASALEVGDGVLVTDPGYPCCRHMAAVVGGVVHELPLSATNGWQLTGRMLATHWRQGTRALILTSPGNPTGAVTAPGDLQDIYTLAVARGAALIVDETYQGLVYDASDHTALACGDQALVVNSFSKYFGLTGWRLGWLVVPPTWVSAVERLVQNLFLAPPTLAQSIGLAALEPEVLVELDGRCAILRRRRDLLLNALRRLGFRISGTPQGAFYVWADVPASWSGGQAYSERALAQAAVAIAPGSDFGCGATARMVRFAYTDQEARLQLAMERLAALEPDA